MQSSSGPTSTTNTRHVPVLLQEVLNVLNIEKDAIVLDGTLGGGGHALAFVTKLGPKGTLYGFDVDSGAIKRTEQCLAEAETKVVLIRANFRDLVKVADEHDIPKLNIAFFDLGWSSDQLEVSGRGFSFNRDEPLQMTLADVDPDSALTAYTIVNTWKEESLADIIFGWGGERYARRIARAIVTVRSDEDIETTKQLAEIVARAVPAVYRHGKNHPATKTFQALRIAVNDELGALQELLSVLPEHMKDGGRVAFLSFHSLEDKLIKETFRNWAKSEMGEIITKKPVTPTSTEVGQNPRSRSAKLRAFTFTHYEGKTKQ